MNILGVLTPLIYFAVVILLTWLVARFASGLIGRIMSRSTPAVALQAQRAIWVLVWAVGLILAIEMLGLYAEILLVFVALLGIGVIVTLRKPLENMGARYFTDVYVPFRVGDSISIQGHTGKVIEMNAISTVILDEKNHLVSIPNTSFMEEVAVNVTPQAWKELVVPIVIGNDIDLATFESEVLRSLGKLQLHLDKRFPPVLTTKSRSAQSAELTLRLYIKSPEERDTMLTEVNKRITEVIESIRKSKQ
jgi:small-conductance mechanosensitive channel